MLSDDIFEKSLTLKKQPKAGFREIFFHSAYYTGNCHGARWPSGKRYYSQKYIELMGESKKTMLFCTNVIMYMTGKKQITSGKGAINIALDLMLNLEN